MQSLKRIVLSAAVLLPSMALLAGQGNSQVAPGSKLHIWGIDRMRGASPAAPTSAATTRSIVYNGGVVLSDPTTYAIWWGKPSDFPSDALEAMDTFLEGLEGSDYLRIANQYMLGNTAHTRFGGNLFDSSAPPTQPLALNAQGIDVVTPEILKVLQNNGLKVDPTAIYMLFTSNFPTDAAAQSYCAFHASTFSPDGTLFFLAYMPNPASALSDCGTNSDPLFTPNNYSEATRAIANFTAHEFMETITDPNGDAWINTDGAEIGDLCAFQYQTWVPLTESRWKIQEIWSNQVTGCAQGAGREARVLGALSSSRATTAFDIPAATSGTFVRSINAQGAIAGYYIEDDHNDVYSTFHSFVRDNLGAVTAIDPPGAGFAVADSINAKGTIAGTYADTTGTHGFLRDKHGTFTTIDAPGAGTSGFFAGTFAYSISNDGAVAGVYGDDGGVNHGYVRDQNGAITTFDAPGAANGVFGGTITSSINSDATVTGFYVDANSVHHGFVRDKHGIITTFDAPDAGNVAGAGTFAYSINEDGTIVGQYTDAQFRNHSYIRDKHGLITTFDAPNAIYGTFAYSINDDGAVAGYHSDASGFPHGFVRDKHGNFTTIDTPGKTYGTVLRSINNEGAVAGYHTAPTP
jgi:uncharacterized membrane protein